MMTPELIHDVARNIIERAVDAAPGLFQGGNGNWIAHVKADLSARIATDLAARGVLPPDDRLEDAEVFELLAFQLGRIPKSQLAAVNRSFTTREEFLASERAEIARRIIRGLDERGYRLVKGVVVRPGHLGQVMVDPTAWARENG